MIRAGEEAGRPQEPTGESRDEVAQLVRPLDHERQVQRREHGGQPVEPLHPQHDPRPALGAWFHHRDARGKPGVDLLGGALDPQRHLVPVRRGRDPGQHAFRRVDRAGRVERTRQGPDGDHAVQPERPVLADRRIGARHVPPARVRDESVRVERAVAPLAVPGGVPERHRPVVGHRVGDREQDRRVRNGRRLAPVGERERAQHRVEPAGEPCGQHPPDLRRRRLTRCTRHQTRDQAYQHRQGLVVAQHQRRHTVPGSEPVSAVAAAHRFDRHVEVEQVADVPAHGAFVHVEALGEFAHGTDAS
ncbi:hypothetical protein GCM10011609_30490 [Lentzea pudingi]|uniref:Uncharacterized protein n=1 Tax=Lentzea pudingi TaxID=1789439 RepID=A0ABQ2HUK8_9PSEU|nr:hypothetical protein GCM10011609_30490 [Lentzea pudingi]